MLTFALLKVNNDFQQSGLKDISIAKVVQTLWIVFLMVFAKFAKLLIFRKMQKNLKKIFKKVCSQRKNNYLCNTKQNEIVEMSKQRQG